MISEITQCLRRKEALRLRDGPLLHMKSRENFNQHLLHPWANHPALGKDDTTPQICRAKGVYLYDNSDHQ